MLVLFAFAAVANTICLHPTVTVSVPSAGAELVAVDGDLLLGVAGPGLCGTGGESPLRFELRDANGARLFGDDRTIVWNDDQATVVVIDPPDDLAPDAAFVLVVSVDEMEEVQIPFETGDGEAAPFDGVPTIELQSYEHHHGQTTAVVDVTPADAIDGTSLLTVENDGSTVAVLEAANDDDAPLSWPSRRSPEVCVTVTQHDVVGGTITSDPSCLSHGCDSAPHAASFLGILLAIAGMTRKRIG